MRYVTVLNLCFFVGCAGVALGQGPRARHSRALNSILAERSPTAVGPHGGSLKVASDVQIETVVDQSGIRVFAFSKQGTAIAVDRGRGLAVLRVQGNAKRYRYDLLPDGKGGLLAPVNLAQIADRQIEIDIQLVGIGETGIHFNEVATVPAGEMRAAGTTLARQKTCPVSGKPLGSMGDPVSVAVSGQTVYVCCAGCVDAIKANPAKYLTEVHGLQSQARVPAGTEQVREGVFKAAEADAPFVAAQQKCPVMDEPLNAMGGPFKVQVSGKAIYICCPGCAKKITANPEKYLAVLHTQGVDPPAIE